MKKRLLLAVVMLLAVGNISRLQAQNVGIDLKDLNAMNDKIDNLTKDKAALEDTIKALKQIIKQTEDKLADTEKNNPLKPQIEELIKDTTRLNADLRKALADKTEAEKRLEQEKQSKSKQELRALKDSIAKLNGQIDDMLRQHAALQQQKEQSDTLLERALAEQKELQAVKDDIVQQLVQQIDAWQQLPLSQLRMDELQRAKQQCMKYGQESPEAAEAAKKLSPLYDDVRTLQDAKDCLEKPFDRAVVKMNHESLKEVYQRRSNEKELQEVITQLGDYPSAIQLFKGLIDEVEKAVGKQTKHAAAMPDVNALLADPDQVSNMDGIKAIPWLAKQLDCYLNELHKNCIKPGNVPETIKKL